ncbi:MAG: GSCFA domain-containing protein [Bacteroidia bacterium]|nr:GSCFA domain-containing protein [Bacteroidia bacterium]
MQFRTIIDIPESSNKISHQTGLLMMGSCFTEYIGEKFRALKYPVDINPFGIVFNPFSVAHCLEFILEKKRFSLFDLEYSGDRWLSMFHHGDFSGKDPQLCIQNINRRLAESENFLEKAGFLLITFGTAWVYEYKKTGQIVANCHKKPAGEFTRRLAEPQEIVGKYCSLIKRLHQFYPALSFIFTVSPVRHLSDGLPGNQVSKATLALAIDRLLRKFENNEIHMDYFPAYEIMMDDLRDYRFYTEDMLHPGKFAIDYIWEIFENHYIELTSIELNRKLEKIIRATGHKPIDRESEGYRLFARKNLEELGELKNQYPFLDLAEETRFFEMIIQ